MDTKGTKAGQPNEAQNSKIPSQRPPMGGSKMPSMNNGKTGKAGANFVKPNRILRAAKGR